MLLIFFKKNKKSLWVESKPSLVHIFRVGTMVVSLFCCYKWITHLPLEPIDQNFSREIINKLSLIIVCNVNDITQSWKARLLGTKWKLPNYSNICNKLKWSIANPSCINQYIHMITRFVRVHLIILYIIH